MEKSGFPYLVDISVGNYCTFGCPFCYTSSTEQGKYADSTNLGVLADILCDAKVFNVVFGGGEPTLYKNNYTNFLYILEKYAHKNFTIGVTTKNYNYYKKDTFKDEIQMIHSLAVSCQTIDELEKLAKLKENIPYGTSTVYAQTILGATSQSNMEAFIKRAKELGIYNVTLLGYKDFGFGTTYQAHKIEDDWIDFVKNCGVNIGIDSILANKYKDKLIERGVRHYTLVGKEGKNTCYIDALKMVVKPSSFCNEEYPILTDKINSIYKYNATTFLETFAKF